MAAEFLSPTPEEMGYEEPRHHVAPEWEEEVTPEDRSLKTKVQLQQELAEQDEKINTLMAENEQLRMHAEKASSPEAI